MKIKNPEKYEFLGFRKSKTKNKKYDAILVDPITNDIKRVPFGDIRYQQYKDMVPLHLYSYLDHNDEKRRERYLARHHKDINNKFSSGYFSAKFLW